LPSTRAAQRGAAAARRLGGDSGSHPSAARPRGGTLPVRVDRPQPNSGR
jgi:hypothetical protein